MKDENYKDKNAPRNAKDNIVFIGNKPFMNLA